MPLQIIENQTDIKLGLWTIAPEDVDFLDSFPFGADEAAILSRVHHPSKRLQWAASRQCARKLLNLPDAQPILNNPKGAPFLPDLPIKLSLSHTPGRTAALASDKHWVGVDVENIDPKRNLAARRMFLNPEESACFDRFPNSKTFFMFWAAKECMFKIFNHFFDEISFRHQLFTQPPPDGFGEAGSFTAGMRRGDFSCDFTVNYQLNDDYVLCWITIENEILSGLTPELTDLAAGFCK